MAATYPIDFGRYSLVERLAVGGMAEVFLATAPGEHGFQKQVVIKRLLPHLTADPSHNAMFIDEAKLTARLVHPKIAQTYELGKVDELLFIAMEYVHGIDVLALLRAFAAGGRRVEAPLAAWIAHEVLDALDYAHGLCDERGEPLGIVHRDISPSNVLLSMRGDVKLVDFGIARARDPGRAHKSKSGTLKGKYGYMSPEQVVDQPLDQRSDLFSVGIVLAEMLMGRRLFAATNEVDVLLMVRDARLGRLEKHGADIEPALGEILRRALRRDVDERWQSAAQFRDALSNWLFEQRHRVAPRDIAALVGELHAGVVARRTANLAAVADPAGPALDEAGPSLGGVSVEGAPAVVAAAEAPGEAPTPGAGPADVRGPAPAPPDGPGPRRRGSTVLGRPGPGPTRDSLPARPVHRATRGGVSGAPGTPEPPSGPGAPSPAELAAVHGRAPLPPLPLPSSVARAKTLVPTGSLPAPPAPWPGPASSQGVPAGVPAPPASAAAAEVAPAGAGAGPGAWAGPAADLAAPPAPAAPPEVLALAPPFPELPPAPVAGTPAPFVVDLLDGAPVAPAAPPAVVAPAGGPALALPRVSTVEAFEAAFDAAVDERGGRPAERAPAPRQDAGPAAAPAAAPALAAPAADALASAPPPGRDATSARGDVAGGDFDVVTDVHEPRVASVPLVLVTPVDAPDDHGDFAAISPLRVMFRLLTTRASGMLLVSVGGIKKEIYVRDGQPEHVASNVASELFGNYLVTRGALTEGELAMALAMMPHYGGKLGDSLIGLGLLRPLEIFRHLTRQVRAKLIDVCTWTKGEFAWYAGRENPREAFPLDFNALEVLGAGALALPDEVVDAWLARAGELRLRASRARRIGPERFEVRGLGEAFEALDGRRTVRELVEALPERADRLKQARLLLLLEACELARTG